MASSAVHTLTKLKDEAFFIVCTENLRGPRSNPIQAATIQTIDTVRLERQVASDPETWEVAVAAEGFTALQVLDDLPFTDAIIGGVITADRDSSPAPGRDYMIVAECTIQFVAAFGGGQTGRVFRRPVEIPATSVTAPVS